MLPSRFITTPLQTKIMHGEMRRAREGSCEVDDLCCKPAKARPATNQHHYLKGMNEMNHPGLECIHINVAGFWTIVMRWRCTRSEIGWVDPCCLAETTRTVWCMWLDRVSQGDSPVKRYLLCLTQIERNPTESMAAPAGIGAGQEDARGSIQELGLPVRAPKRKGPVF